MAQINCNAAAMQMRKNTVKTLVKSAMTVATDRGKIGQSRPRCASLSAAIFPGMARKEPVVFSTSHFVASGRQNCR